MNSKQSTRFYASVLVVVVASVVWWVCFGISTQVPSPRSDTWDYIQLDRSLAEGHGFQSLFTYPILLSIDAEPPFPTLWRLPVYPLVCTLPHWVFESPGPVIFIQLSGVFYVLSCSLFFWWTLHLFSVRYSLLGTGMWILNPHLLSASLEGLSEPFYLCVLLLLFIYLTRWGGAKPVALGVLIGLAWLTRSNTLFFIPGLILFLAMQKGDPALRVKRLAWMALAAIAICVPWWVRNWIATGDPFFNMSRFLPLMFTEEWPGWTLFRTDFASLSAVPRMDWGQKMLDGIPALWSFGIVQRFLSCNPVIFALAGIGLWTIWRDRNARWQWVPWAAFFAITDLFTAVFLSLVEPAIRLYLPAMILLYAMALKGLEQLTRRRATRVWLVVLGSLVAVSVLVYFFRFGTRLGEVSWRPLTQAEVERVLGELPQGAIVLSDTPDYVSATLHTPSIFLPTPSTLSGILERWDGPLVLHLSDAFEGFVEEEGESSAQWIEQSRHKENQRVETESGHFLTLFPGENRDKSRI